MYVGGKKVKGRTKLEQEQIWNGYKMFHEDTESESVGSFDMYSEPLMGISTECEDPEPKKHEHTNFHT